MTHFEAYHWEDHVPRAGSWKFNLAAGVLALGLIYAALPDAPGNAPVAASAHAATTRDPDVKVHPLPVAQEIEDDWAYCPITRADYADS